MGDLTMGMIKDALTGLTSVIKVRAAMPGHKGKLIVDGSHDVTELPGMDNLQNPQGILKAAEEVCARFYGVSSARFLVNGSTCGNLAMVFSFFEEGDEVLIERNCHKSVYNALLLRKLRPCYLWPSTDDLGNSLPQSGEAVQRALKAHPEARGIILTQPSYKGTFSDFEAIARIARASGVHLLLDAAHGAAMAGMPGFESFYSSCDAMVVSTHKSLACLNQGAVLLLNRPEYESKILKYTNMFQTTSPSYLILESIESSLEELAAGLYLESPSFDGPAYRNLVLNPVPAGMQRDPWKLLVHCAGQGEFMEDYLEERGIYPEFHDADSVLLMLSPANSSGELDHLRQVLAELDTQPELVRRSIHRAGEPKVAASANPEPPKVVLAPHLVGDDYIEVELESAAGRIAQEQVIPYPPGVPVLVPGEAIDDAMTAYIRSLRDANVAILGLHDNKLRCLREEI